jgi:hypothetical protein
VTSAMALKPSGSRSQTLSLFDAGGEPTLDDVLAGVWEGLAACATAACPICGGPMEPVRGPAPGPRPEAGRCTSCGSSLS